MVTASEILKLLKEKKSRLKSRVDNPKVKWYLVSYPYFVGYFEELEKIEEQDLIRGIAMAYSWMPTIPGVKIGRLLTEENLRLANDIFKNRIEEEKKKEVIGKIKRIVNNSMVGASKLMHFLNPEGYPIWDSNICEYLDYRSDLVEDYVSYQQYCNDVINSSEYSEIMQILFEINPKYAERVPSDYRIIEQCLWLLASDKP